jgi:hypothetical protein
MLSGVSEDEVKNPRGAGAENAFGIFVKPVHHWQNSKVPAVELDRGSAKL